MAWGTQGQSAFATFLIICPTSFFLGILFSLFPYDYPVLWTSAPCPPEAFTNLEHHLKFLHNSPLIITRLLHTVIGTGLLGFFIKLYRPSQSNKLFDGASLMLYVVGIIIYVANIAKGMRIVASGIYEADLAEGESTLGTTSVVPGEEVPLGRDDSLRVMAATNTILALVLVGVLVLQAGQWYAERKEGQEVEKYMEERAAKTESRASEGSKHRSAANSKKKN